MVKKRRRVSFGQSFREMREARRNAPSAGVDGDIVMALATVPLATWYWIAGVPENAEPLEDASTASRNDEVIEPDWERRDREIWSDDET